MTTKDWTFSKTSAGSGYYDLDDGEGKCFNFELVPLLRLLEDVSYSANVHSALFLKLQKPKV